MIRIQNIYYMLAYAFSVLKEQGYSDCAIEEFDNTADLMSEILIKGISIQLKRGLNHEYIHIQESVLSPRGKIDITQSVKNQTMMNHQLICDYDEYSTNSYMNQILKTTMLLLLKCDINYIRKKKLRQLLMYFNDVSKLDYHRINWNISYNQNNQSYHMLINICYMIIKGLLQVDDKGYIKMQKFLDEQRMCRLYEKFLLEYYRQEFPDIKVHPSQIKWQLDDDMSNMLPIMQSDIMLSKEEKILIIDAKYYQHVMQSQYNVQTLHSNNLYQIFTYVKNKEAELAHQPHIVSAMLLYAKTDEDISPNNTYLMSGNKISVRTLDLNLPFHYITQQLNDIVDEYLKS
ncbi:MAG: 5-methylcytosine-specific restriction endonuclease system specificity protein McrC [Erysipelotrichaceae bacterium]|nr:5-methylcytosine-specific restriction endonuclease system specificity protein McrC [Erysipelotrichaceae bacterium]